MIQKRIMYKEREREIEREGGKGERERERERELCCIRTYDTKETNIYNEECDRERVRGRESEREREWERGEKERERKRERVVMECLESDFLTMINTIQYLP